MKKEEGRMKKENGLRDRLPLTLSQWLPKPATSQLPKLERALRAMWSPLQSRGARESETFVTSLACEDALPSAT
jgi:hypothetical protein